MDNKKIVAKVKKAIDKLAKVWNSYDKGQKVLFSLILFFFFYLRTYWWFFLFCYLIIKTISYITKKTPFLTKFFTKNFKLILRFNLFFFIILSLFGDPDSIFNKVYITYQEFGFVKRSLIRSLLDFLNIPLSNEKSIYTFGIIISVLFISVLVLFFTNFSKMILKNRNYFLFFFLFLCFFYSPFSIYQFSYNWNFLVSDGLNFAVFIFCVTLISQYQSTFILLIVSILSGLSILNHELYVIFFLPALVVLLIDKEISFLNKKELNHFIRILLYKLALFLVIPCVLFLFVVFYGEIEQFSNLQALTAFIHSKKPEMKSTIKILDICGVTRLFPYYKAGIKDDILLTQCEIFTFHKNYFSFYLIIAYYLLWIYLFIDILKRNNKNILLHLLFMIPTYLLFFIAYDTGRFVSFSILTICVLLFYFSTQKKLLYNKKLIYIVCFPMFLGFPLIRGTYDIYYINPFLIRLMDFVLQNLHLYFK